MIIEPKLRGFICTTSHPDGCAAHVQQQIDHVRSRPPMANPPKNVLVIGSSTGYGLASRITPAFSAGAATIGVFFERPADGRRTGTAGWYNTAAFEKAAHAEGIYAKSLNGDAFSNEIKQQTIDLIKADLGQVDCVVYSLASPRRTDPTDGETYKSVLKPIGASYTNKNLDTEKGIVNEVSIDPANDQEIADTVKVMGGEDWEMWIDALSEAGVLADGATTVAYSYIGPEATWPIYRDGTIGRAKIDLQDTSDRLAEKLKATGGRSYVSVNKALVTQASSAIPVVPLYISLLYQDMKERGLHEGCIEQIARLFGDRLYADSAPELDDQGRIRIDDWEMREDVQAAIATAWETVNTDNIADLGDVAGYREEFLRLFGFGIDGIDYAADIDPEIGVPSIS